VLHAAGSAFVAGADRAVLAGAIVVVVGVVIAFRAFRPVRPVRPVRPEAAADVAADVAAEVRVPAGAVGG